MLLLLLVETSTACVELVVVGVGDNVVVGTEDRDREAEIEAGIEDGATDRVEVAASEKREPVRLYAAAQAARSIPSGQHQVPPEASEVQ